MNEGGSFTSIHEPGETSHVLAGWTGGSGRGGTTKNYHPSHPKQPKRIPLHFSRLQLLEVAGIQNKIRIIRTVPDTSLPSDAIEMVSVFFSQFLCDNVCWPLSTVDSL